ncbi:putative NT-type C2 domain-containing protein [Helianthus annuus]|nr:putative NT-type C2 domain-containing protein [Helianthus annuus]
MVVNVIKWRPWPPLLSKKFKVKLVVKKMEGGRCDPVHEKDYHNNRAVEIRWKGPKISLTSFRRTVKRNFTREVKVVESNGVVQWDEEFHTICTLSGSKENAFNPWEIGFTVLNGLSAGPKNKIPIIGTASLNLAEFVSATEEKDLDLTIPLTLSCEATEPHPTLHIQLSLMELRADQEPAEPTQSQSQTSESSSEEKDELSALKAGLRKVKIFTESIRRGRKTSGDDDHDNRSDEGDLSSYPFDSESLEGSEEGELNEVKEDDDATFRKSFSYGTLAYANCTTGSLYEDGVYYSNRKSDVGCSQNDDSNASVSEPYVIPSQKRVIFPWRKRKMNLRSPKTKGEPLLKKAYAEEGGDDIDFDRRQLSPDQSLAWYMLNNQSSVSEFGDDDFAVGNWEQREIISRDSHMKLRTQVFFASIDQRSERAAGESACTVLVAVIADWFQNNHDHMPIKSQLDSLIREGSLEWRNLCENEIYRTRFPDKHFDLDTILEANLRPLLVVPEKSFIGFFHPEEIQEGSFDFLHGAMSFDTMWDEISRESEPRVYIVSWNDHFFVLKVDSDAYYIIDTLGERLFEGCNQAYNLKFDRNTVIYQLPSSESSSDDSNRKSTSEAVEPVKHTIENEVICEGKEACKVYLKCFLAAIPIRELQADMKKGLVSSTPLHHRLQIEFHYTQLQPPPADTTASPDLVPVVATSAPVVDDTAKPVVT